MITPGNVPAPPRGREFWELDLATWEQMRSIRWRLKFMNINAEEYFGDGFLSVQGLNKWAAAWAIDDLKRLQNLVDAKALQDDVDRVNEDVEPRMKEAIANWFRAKS